MPKNKITAPRVTEPIIAAASVTSGTSGGMGKTGLGQAIEAAMAEATKACFAKGVTDDDSIREAKFKARAAVKKEFAAADAAASKPADG